MRLALAADHAGFPTKQELVGYLRNRGHEVLDLGTHSTDAVDYPDCAVAAAAAVKDGRAERAVIVCGSGAGVSIAANKIPGIRAAVCHDTYTAHQAVEHDDLNVLCIGGRVVGLNVAQELVDAFTAARFSGEPRHQRRLDKVLAIEAKYQRA